MRQILHSDLNSFYASVELVLDPSLRRRPVAVCGSRETRHGIVLAKSDPAKRLGVATGMAIWEARECCPDLIILPPHYEEYLRYSNMVRNIYARYTGFIEPFGLDECWLDVTGVPGRTGFDIADEIRRTIRDETKLTVSIGVSFNKIFAKLGSDMKKPDAITEIPYETFREKIWNLPAADMLGVGPATQNKLHMRGIDTIGQLARADTGLLKSWFGINGPRLWAYANGFDQSPVAPDGFIPIAKSIGHGMTTSTDLLSEDNVRSIIVLLAPSISRRLRQSRLKAKGFQMSLRTNDLAFHQFQGKLPYPTQTTRVFVEFALAMFREHFRWHRPIMAVTLRAINLVSENESVQLDMFGNVEERERQEKLERTIEYIQDRFGRGAIRPASTLSATFVDKHPELEFMHMPRHMYT